MTEFNVVDAAASRDYEALAARAFPVVEAFGPTVQGEGALAGTVSHFIRFGGCDYGCAWCDSAPAVIPADVRKADKLTRDQIMARVDTLPPAQWVTLSGGNPALHDLELVVDSLHFRGFKVAVETQGTLWKPWLATVEQLTISPKPPSARMADVLNNTTASEGFARFMRQVHAKTNPILKVPIFDMFDFEWATELHRRWGWYPFYLSVVTRMGGLRGDWQEGILDTRNDILDRYKQVAEWTLGEPDMKDARVLPQLHALVWGHDRGH